MATKNIDGTGSPRFQLNADTEAGPVLVDESPGDSVLARRNNDDDAYIRDRGLPMVADADVEVSYDLNGDVDRVTAWKIGSSRSIKLQEVMVTRDGAGDPSEAACAHHDDSGALLTGLTNTVTVTRAPNGDPITLDDVWA